MQVVLREAADAERLREQVRTEASAKRRDRYRAVLLALDGKTKKQICQMLGRSVHFVQDWVYGYRDQGMDGLKGGQYPGRRSKLAPAAEQRLRERLDAGPRPEDGVCAFRGTDIRRILNIELGVLYSNSGAYNLLNRLGYSSLVPRPRHPKNNPEEAERFKASAPFLSSR
jgi:transposase